MVPGDVLRLCSSAACRLAPNSDFLGWNRRLWPAADLIGLPRSRRRPADERRRAPASLSPSDASFAILGAVVARLGRASEQCTVIERIDVDDAPHPASDRQSHCDVDAAPSADDLIGGFKTERVALKVLRIGGRQCHVRLGIGESPRIVLTTKRTLACAKHLVAWLPVGCQLDTNGTAVTLTLEEHVSVPSPKSRQRHWNSCAHIGPLWGAAQKAIY
jgi:hypothetical protein